MDLNGNLGGDFFDVGAVGVTYATTNTRTATVSATRTDVGSLTLNDYVITNTATPNNTSARWPIIKPPEAHAVPVSRGTM